MAPSDACPSSEQARQGVLEAYEACGTWRGVAARYGVSVGTAWRVAHGHNPASPAIRTKLGLEPDLARLQFLDYRLCVRCGAPFVPNTARRNHCFVCHPFQRRLIP